jgi:acyl-coenzyme A synthetase/AMP-(fatty) acid ligase/glyceraldehyde-3-phosphate dehydrogenase/erythrose-4-phosphate dehydrogenase
MGQHNTLVDYLLDNGRNDKYIYEIETGLKKTHKEILENAITISNNNYISKNQIATVILPNSIAYIEHFLAAILGGYIFNPLPYFTQVQELEKIFEYIDPAIIVTDRDDIISRYSQTKNVYTIDQFEVFSGDEYKRIRSTLDPDQIAALYYSSGTTGNPKGILYSNKNMVSLISSIVKGFRFSNNDHQLAFLPFGHTASVNYNILPSLMVGCNLYISQGFENLRSNFFEVLEKYKITYTEIVPTVLFLLNKLKIDVGNLNLSDLEFIGCGSSALPLSSQNEFIKQYGIKIGNMYGLSETGPTHIDDPRVVGWNPGSVGIPLDVNKCRINKYGEILIRGDNVFSGYYKNESLYRKVITNDWFNTGDLGVEKEGRLYFVDRKKDLIIKSGINIVPMEIEEVIYEHPSILECVAVGKDSQIFGEEIVVVAVKNDSIDSSQLIREIKQLCKKKLSNYKVPNQIYFWDSIPKTPSNKLLRKKVRELINANQKYVADSEFLKKSDEFKRRVAGINGFGRFGLHLIKYWLDRYDRSNFNIKYINDDTLNIDQAIEIIKSDTKVVFDEYTIEKIGSHIRFSWKEGEALDILYTNSLKSEIPWLGKPELFFECSGKNTTRKDSDDFLVEKTKLVIISATSWDADKTLVYGFNHKEYDLNQHQVISYGSCTVNAFVPLTDFINKTYGLIDSDVNVIHNVQKYRLKENYTLDRRFCTLEKSAPRLMTCINDNLAVKYTIIPYTGVSMIDFRFRLKNPPLLDDFIENIEQEINNGVLKGIYGFREIDNGPEEINCTSFSSVFIKEKVQLLGDQLYMFAYFDNENSVNRYYDLVDYIADNNINKSR